MIDHKKKHTSSIGKNKMRLSWNPDIDPETEDRLVFLAMSGPEKWQSLNRLILGNRKLPLTFHKRIIKWI
tara:strand:+ start:1397 stop:1606 length:210 start_codon:yes stop_codon:yes gene_type:complete